MIKKSHSKSSKSKEGFFLNMSPRRKDKEMAEKTRQEQLMHDQLNQKDALISQLTVLYLLLYSFNTFSYLPIRLKFYFKKEN
jgi:hypothetical protein